MEDNTKTFTQEEVNRIVSKRLSEEKEKMQKEQDAAIAEIEKSVKAREMRMNAIEKLHANGLPSDLADVLNCSDDESLDRSIEILSHTYRKESVHEKQRYSPMGGSANNTDDPIRRAMGL